MDGQPYPLDPEQDDLRPAKRARHTPSPAKTNGNGHARDQDLPPLSQSILGVEPIDELIKEVADWVHHVVTHRQERVGVVEVEAKIGLLKDPATGQRFTLPILTESILPPQFKGPHFESNMSPMQHRHYNQMLNNLKISSTQPKWPSTPISYAHLHLVDTFYGPDHDKIRVTREERTGNVVACVRKVRLGSLNIFCPKQVADWRISVNVEIDVSPPIGTSVLTRKKDRMRYTHEEFFVDLTQVTSSISPNSPTEIFHELEIEIARPDYLLTTMANRGNPSIPVDDRNAYDELIRAFVNNARILVRNADARPPGPPVA
ncbi:hypothetical protein NM688_g2890 [Phlebia brevispora]|uniref:Uncharacterized protein n=1 Tax=Phlebia brevispora TaxID=194682 RepID=A0ACC1T808_9APHY|nr:hypothetical protein NM688_g2890 [Phlebia brevispora]